MILKTEAELEERLARPSEADKAFMRELEGDLLILGVAGKMGPSLARRARRAADEAGVRKRIIGAARFSNARVREELEAAGVETITAERAATVDRNLELSRRFTLATFADPTIADDIPDGAMVVLIPDDDPDHARANIEIGLAAVRRGENVYFRHVRMAELPDEPVASKPAEAQGPGVVLRRTLFRPDGAIESVAIRGTDGEWHPVAPNDDPGDADSGAEAPNR